ncbi:hypothetical protein FACS189430_07240 [Bacteroidia bacterium]|nr:hypothetical protein FACS189430_07240 [Bacteroidia bacterium]
MKKLILSIGAVLFIALAAVNVHLNMNIKSVSSLKLANIKALSQEGGNNVEICYSTYRITLTNQNQPEPVWVITKCSGCSQVNCYEYRDSSTCTASGYMWV